MDIQHAVIAAAGFGSRLHQGIPKCLVEINGHKIIEYQLALLQDVPDVRIIIGYHGDEVARIVKALRPDIKCVSNPRYDSTTTLQSYYMGCNDIHDFFMLIDGDIIPHKTSFRHFLSQFSGENIIGISPASTQDAVFVHTDEQNRIVEFSRTKPSPFEWSNIAMLHADILADEPVYVYQCIEKKLPMQAVTVERLEIDTALDMQFALNAIKETQEYSL